MCLACLPPWLKRRSQNPASVPQINDAQLGGGALSGARHGFRPLAGEAGPGSAHLAGSGAAGNPFALR